MNKFISIVKSSVFKRLIIVLLLLILFIFISAISYVSAVSNNIANGVFRLHVIANSDTEEDQNLKLKVRDEVISYLQPKLKDSKSIQESEKIILNEEDKLMDICKETIKENGYDYDVSINLGYSKFPTKQYSSVVLPAGEYKALKIVIGKGQGRNWWCVMFPPLCFIDVTKGQVAYDETEKKMKDVLSEEEFKSVNKKENNVNFEFKVIDLFK